MIDRRSFFMGLAAFAAAPVVAFQNAKAAITAAQWNYPFNPLHFRAMITLRKAAKSLTDDGTGLTTISATCRHLRGEKGTFDPWFVSLHSFDILYRATEQLTEMGLSKPEINAALSRLDLEHELRYVHRTMHA